MDTKKTARIVQYNAVHPKPRQRHTAEARQRHAAKPGRDTQRKVLLALSGQRESMLAGLAGAAGTERKARRQGRERACWLGWQVLPPTPPAPQRLSSLSFGRADLGNTASCRFASCQHCGSVSTAEVSALLPVSFARAFRELSESHLAFLEPRAFREPSLARAEPCESRAGQHFSQAEVPVSFGDGCFGEVSALGEVVLPLPGERCLPGERWCCPCRVSALGTVSFGKLLSPRTHAMRPSAHA